MTAIHPSMSINHRDWDSHPDDFPKIKTNLSYPSQVASLIRQQIKRGMPDAPQGCSVISAGIYTRAESGGRDNYIEFTKERGQLSDNGLIRLDVHSQLSRTDRQKLFRMVCRVLHINNVMHSWSQCTSESISLYMNYQFCSDENGFMTGNGGEVNYRNLVFNKKTGEYVKNVEGDHVYRAGERKIKPLFAYTEDL